MANFETHVERIIPDQKALFCLLLQHCESPAKEKISHFAERGLQCYDLAKEQLYKEYGRPWIVAEACERNSKEF